jgi:ABC-type branched-subunit amino acid transport system substrate-binding protein
MTEYYSGLLLAIESMRNQGFWMELFVYDIGDDKNDAETRRLLQAKREELRKVNLIIGGGHSPEQIKLIADFAKQNQIKYVTPFSSNDENVLDNAYLFQMNTPSQYLNAFAANAGANLFGKYNIIFLDTKDTLPQTDFIRDFKQELKDRYISYKEAVHDVTNFDANIQSLLSESKPNLVVLVSQSLVALQKIKSELRMIAETNPDYNLTLYGYTRWLTYLEDCLEDFHVLNTYIYSRFYADNLHPDVKTFYDKYKNWYIRNPVQSNPQFALLGYDTGMYFFSALQKYGVNFEDNLADMNYKSLQTGFNFIRVNDEGGFINSNIYIVHFNKDFSITRSDFK